MWLRRKQEEAPEGVRVKQPGGITVECDIFRDAEADREGWAVWVAVPRDNFVLPDDCVLQIDVLPEKTIVELAAWFDV